MAVGVRALPARVAGLSLAALGAGYVGVVVGALAVLAFVPALRAVGRGLDGLLFLALFVAVTWFRDEDALAAGVFLAVTTGLAQFAVRVLVEVETSGGVGGVVLMLPTVGMSILVRAVLAGLVCAGLVWVARAITLAVRPGWRPPAHAAAPAGTGRAGGLFPKRRA